MVASSEDKFNKLIIDVVPFLTVTNMYQISFNSEWVQCLYWVICPGMNLLGTLPISMH